MLDCHFHLDRFPDPHTIAAQAAGRGVFVVAVTNLPSHFEQGLVHVRALKQVRLALGLHPLAASDHLHELAVFDRLFSETSFIGEVGLDFSRHGKASAPQQLETFRHVARRVAGAGKLMSLHSRGADEKVLDVLTEFGIVGAIFHWYTGPLDMLDRIVDAGHFLSVNPAMTQAAKGRAIIRRIPRERLLTETDGPHVKVGGVPAMPWDVAGVENAVAEWWGCSNLTVRQQVWQNFRGLVNDRIGDTM